MNFQEAIVAISSYLELPELIKNQAGNYPLTLDDVLEIELSENQQDNTICFLGIVIDVPRDHKQEKFIKYILKVNLARAKVNNDFLAVDPKNKTLTLHQALPLEGIEATDLTKMFEDFVNNLEFWQKVAQDTVDQNSSFNPIFPVFP